MSRKGKDDTMAVKLHRLTGALIAIFLASHLAVHLFALGGADAHMRALRSIQWLYRNALIEPLLVAALLLQIGLGLRLAIPRWREPGKGGWAKLQIASGLYLGYFIINHTGAALYTRYVAGLDTNFWWVSGSLLHPVLKWWFYPYYALVILAVATHLGAFFYFRGKVRVAKAAVGSGFALVAVYWASFGGWFYQLDIHPDYQSYYDGILVTIGLG
jgi:hypothetical protein